jgi:hypothetical protein
MSAQDKSLFARIIVVEFIATVQHSTGAAGDAKIV